MGEEKTAKFDGKEGRDKFFAGAEKVIRELKEKYKERDEDEHLPPDDGE